MAAQKDRVIEEAVELADRFPDLPDIEVFDAINHILETFLDEDTVLGNLALFAYNNGKEAAERSIWYE